MRTPLAIAAVAALVLAGCGPGASSQTTGSPNLSPVPRDDEPITSLVTLDEVDCGTDDNGNATATGELTNEDDEPHVFELIVEFRNGADDWYAGAKFTTPLVAPEATADWETRTTTPADLSGRCEVAEVYPVLTEEEGS